MALPTQTTRIAFVNNPADTSWTWVDVSSYVLELHTDRGREDETQQFNVGSVGVVLDNRDRRFDPSNTSSAYNPNVVPMKRVNVQATFSAITYDLFTGFIEDFPIPPAEGLSVTCELKANDVFEVLNNTTVSGEARSIESSDTRIARMLVLAGLPSAAYSLGAGLTDVAAETGDTVELEDGTSFTSYGTWNVLDKIRECEKAERGQLFVNGAGTIIFRNRQYRLLSQTTNNATFGDSGSELPIEVMTTSTGVDLIFNDARASQAATGSTVYAASDATSKTKYLTRSWPSGGSVETTIAAYGAEAEGLAQFMVDRYKDPLPRITAITITGQMDSNIWAQALGRDIGDKVTVNSRYFGKGSTFTQVSRIERIQHDWSASDQFRWHTTWTLSPVSAYELATYWKLQDAASQLGTNTYLAF